MKATEESDTFSKVKHKHDDPVTSVDYAHVHMYIVYVTTRLANSTHSQIIPQQNIKSTAS